MKPCPSSQPNEGSVASVFSIGALATANPALLPSAGQLRGSDPAEDIRVRAETVTEVLQEIVDRQANRRHWGINE